MAVVNRQNVINKSNMQSSLQRLKMQQSRGNSNSDEIISLDDDEDDIVEVDKQPVKRTMGDIRRDMANKMSSSAPNRPPMMPMKRKDPLSLSDVSREKSLPRKRLDMGFKAPETKQSVVRPTDRNANSSLNKNVSVTRVITPGGKKDTEMTKNNRPGQSKIAKEKVKSPSPERKTRGATRQSSASRSEDRDTEE